MWPLESEAEMAEPCFDYVFIQNICAGKIVPDIWSLCFRNPDVFIAGQLHLYSTLWEKISALSSYCMTVRMKFLTGLRIKSPCTSFSSRSKKTLRVVLIILICHPVLNLIITNPVIILLISLTKRCLRGCVVALYQF